VTVQLHTLSNGLRIVTEHMPGLKSASVGVWINAGGRHERIEQNGIAHFLEHMAFKGTARRTALQIAEAIEDVGGYINAYTSRETTAYYARVLENDVPLALDVIADIVMNPAFEQSEIEVERGVILQEIGQVLDTPDDIVFDWLQEVAYPDQPLGRSILGPSERVSKFGRDDLSAFVAERYGPAEMILSAAGAVDHDAIVMAAEKLFGHRAAQPGRAYDPAVFQGGERRESRELEQVHFALALESPDYCHPDFYAAQIYSSALGGGMSSRLFQEAREKRGLCYSIFAQAGATLARLHGMGLSHGRPSLKDMCWNGAQITLIDVERYDPARNTPYGHAQDLLMFTFNAHAVARGHSPEIDAALAAYRDHAPPGIWDRAARLSARLRPLSWLTAPLRLRRAGKAREFKAIPLTLAAFRPPD